MRWRPGDDALGCKLVNAGTDPAGRIPPARVAAAPMLVGVVVLNWNDAVRTLRCIESVLATAYAHRFLVVVDNGSTDGSVANIRGWLDHHRRPLRVLAASETVAPPADGTLLASGGAEPVWIIETGANLGYGAGNNAGIRLAVARGAAAVWVLNNDTVVDRDSLGRITAALQSDPTAGLVGSCLLDDDVDARVQCLGGGRYNAWTSQTTLIGAGLARPVSSSPDEGVDFISGAALLLSVACLRQIGGFEEGYFLYCEEVDLARRARSAGWTSIVVPGSIVRHAHGATLGSSPDRTRRSTASFYFASRAAVLLARKHWPVALPSVMLARVALALYLVVCGRGDAARSVLRGIAAGVTARSWSRVPMMSQTPTARA